MINVLQVNAYESPGARFHGLAITPELLKNGIHSKHFSWFKDTDNPDVISFKDPVNQLSCHLYNKIEQLLSLQSVLFPYAPKIMKLKEFDEADLIHLHIIHSGYFSMRHLPELTKKKPVVWTLHDPWVLTGHCIHPFDCNRWKLGCGQCPDLSSPLPLKRDHTKFLFSYKQKAFQNLDLDLIVSSKWMKDMVEASPMFKKARIHQIPFGLDLNFFSPQNADEARNRLGIQEKAVVISFRADDSPYKGLPYILEALEKINTVVPLCLLTLGKFSIKDKVSDRFQLIELGWVNDQPLIRDFFRASDIFLMPSLAESFGMMAVEAMACGKPVVVFDGTALPDITFAPDVGIVVPKRNSIALSEVMQNLIQNPDERQSRGKNGRKLAEKVYSDQAHVRAIANLYKEVLCL